MRQLGQNQVNIVKISFSISSRGLEPYIPVQSEGDNQCFYSTFPKHFAYGIITTATGKNADQISLIRALSLQFAFKA